MVDGIKSKAVRLLRIIGSPSTGVHERNTAVTKLRELEAKYNISAHDDNLVDIVRGSHVSEPAPVVEDVQVDFYKGPKGLEPVSGKIIDKSDEVGAQMFPRYGGTVGHSDVMKIKYEGE